MIGPWTSKDAEAFADALDGRGPRNSEVQDLVRFAEGLCEAAVDPSPDFLLSLRAELMTDASTVLVRKVAPTSSRRTASAPHPVRRRLTVATAALVTSAGMVGIVASSASALPGEMLYTVKRSVESIESQLHRSEVSRGSFELSQATERLDEASRLAEKNDSRSEALVLESLAEFSAEAESGAQTLFADYVSAGNDSSIDKVNSFAVESGAVLAKLSNDLSPGAADAYNVAASTVTDLATQASDLCAACEEAELSSLADSTNAIAADLAAQRRAAEDPVKTPPKKASPPADGGDTIASPPDKSPIATPAPELPVEEVDKATTPIVGALLGDDEQAGLVPGLLGGLLGGRK